MVVDLSDYSVQGRLYFIGVYEPELTALLMDLLTPGSVFFDVGANVGYYSLLAAARGAVVHAFEPHPALAQQLRRSVALSRSGRRLRVKQAAVGAADGRGELFLSPDPAANGWASLLPLRHLEGGASVRVDIVSLDSYCRLHDVPAVDLVKLDVEGAEADVISGAREVLSKLRPRAIICELSAFDGAPGPRSVIRQLRELGYCPYDITSAGLGPATDACTVEGTTWQQRNVCFLPRNSTPRRPLGARVSVANCTCPSASRELAAG